MAFIVGFGTTESMNTLSAQASEKTPTDEKARIIRLLISVCFIWGFSVSVSPEASFAQTAVIAQSDDNAGESSGGSTVGGDSSQDSELLSGTEQTIATLIEQLADPNFRKRQEAKWELKQYGLIAFEQLRLAAKFSEDIQIAREAKYILDSQETIWWSDSDSIQVRTLLRDYSTSSLRQKLDRIELLGGLGTTDSWLALCRLARYEFREDLSKLAALELIEALLEFAPSSKGVFSSLKLAVGTTSRPSVAWIREALQFRSPEGNAAESVEVLVSWKKILDAECEIVGESMESRSAQIRLCQLADELLKDKLSNKQRLELLESNLPKLIQKSSFEVLSLAQWAIDVQLPEFALALQATHPQMFEESGENTYLLAEAQLRLGYREDAERTAQLANGRMDLSPQAEKLSRKHNLVDLVARNRFRLARRLENRGLYDWAENEFIAALGESSSNLDVAIRKALASFYFDAQDYASAAETLRPIAIEMQEEIEAGRSSRGMQGQERVEVISFYHFYLAQSQFQEDRLPQARESIRKSYEFNRENEDVVILVKKLAKDAPKEFVEFADDCVLQAANEFQRRIIESEQFLANATERERRSAPQRLANDLNRLAWLLVNTNTSVDDALQLSQQSLGLVPNWPNYLDTLAACLEASGEVEQAIQFQQQAVDARPFDRVLRRRLNRLKDLAPK